MNKFVAFLLILIIAPILASLYGVIHDQLTYSISEEYYTKFKFVQFGLENWGLGVNMGTADAPIIRLNTPRLGVAIVGVMATWWVGLIVGVSLGLIGLIHKSGKQMFTITLRAMVLTIVITLFIGFAGLLFARLFPIQQSPNWHLPTNLIDRKRFIWVGVMHNCSYLGGVSG